MRMRRRKWVAPYLASEKHYLLTSDFILDYDRFKHCYLEVGCGLGDFIIAKALAESDSLFIGYEKDDICAAKVIKKAEELNLNNFYIIIDDANNLDKWFNKPIFEGIFLLFSDPWPKKGYYKRRLTYRDFLKKYQMIIKNEGFLYFKTDNDNLYEFSLAEISASKFKIIEHCFDYHSGHIEKFFTGYERRFIEKQMPIHYIFSKIEREV